MQIKIRRYHFSLNKMTIIKKILTSVGEDVEKLKLSYLAGGIAKWFRYFILAVPQNVKHSYYMTQQFQY